MISATQRAILLILFVMGPQVWAASGGQGGWSLGMFLGLVNSSQDQMNEIIKRSNTGVNGPVSTSQLSSAYEAAPFLQYRFSGTMFAIQFRPSYFYQKEDGSGSNGSYGMSVTGFTLFPMLRLYPLENDLMKFYMQFGLGYGRVNGEINQGSGNSVKFASGSFGTLFGMGAEFCFTPDHCLNLEGDYRYLSFERNVVTSSSGAAGELSNNTKGQEVEMDNSDLSVRMGGLMFLAGYTMKF